MLKVVGFNEPEAVAVISNWKPESQGYGHDADIVQGRTSKKMITYFTSSSDPKMQKQSNGTE